MSPFASSAASLGTAWIWDPAAFRPRFVRTMPPLPKVGSRLPAVPATAVEAGARPTARPSTNVPANAAGVRFFTFLVLPGLLDCLPGTRKAAPRRTGSGARGGGARQRTYRRAGGLTGWPQPAQWRDRPAWAASSAPPASSPHHPGVRDALRQTIGPRYKSRSSTAIGSPHYR